jgi:hypothetical protein
VRHAVDVLDDGRAADQQDARRPLALGVDGDRHAGVALQRPHLRRGRHSVEHQLGAVPHERYRDDPRVPVHAGVCQPRRDRRAQQLPRDRLVQHFDDGVVVHVVLLSSERL